MDSSNVVVEGMLPNKERARSSLLSKGTVSFATTFPYCVMYMSWVEARDKYSLRLFFNSVAVIDIQITPFVTKIIAQIVRNKKLNRTKISINQIILWEDKTMMIEAIGEPAMLEQLAEECAELSKAALKAARVRKII